uniref:Uncharacterized protein n=1 Tax=Arundo donax TaxID=35708 RepID=A0A0A8YX07_ARUDO
MILRYARNAIAKGSSTPSSLQNFWSLQDG